MKTLQNQNLIYKKFFSNSLRLATIPTAAFFIVFAFDIAIESTYDFILEVLKVYSLMCLASISGMLVHSTPIKIGMTLSVLNGAFDAATEIVVLATVFDRYPLLDAMLDEALLIIAYAFIMYGLLKYFRNVNNLAITDLLTRCYSRSALDLIPDGKYQLFYMDLDNFKKINNTHGHHYGDQILSRFAYLLMRSCGEQGYAIRLDGDDFLAVVEYQNASAIIDKVIKSCSLEKIRFSYGTAPVLANNFEAAILIAEKDLSTMKQTPKTMLQTDEFDLF